jgi:glycosyltransferase involved in cell wall biosynthesis
MQSDGLSQGASAVGPPPVRCLIWFWGLGGAGIRCAHRIGVDLATHVGRENVAFSLHARHPWIDKAQAVSADVDIVDGAAGRNGGFRHVLELIPRFLQLRRQIRRFRPDVIIVSMNFAQAMPMSAALAVGRSRIVYVVHDAVPHPGDYFPLLQKITQRGLIAMSRQLVFLSAHVGENVRGTLPSRHRKTMTVLNLARQAWRSRETPLALQPDAPVRLLFLGRLLQYKGLDILAEALEHLEHRQDWRLTIAGNGGERDFVLERFGRFRQVDLSRISWLLETEVDDLLATHDIVVCPYTEASQSGVLPEAFSLGIPAIVTPVGALPEQTGFGKAGWVAETATPADLAATIAKALDERDVYQAKSAEALKLVSARPGEAGWAKLMSGLRKRSPRISGSPSDSG